jgi:hypothetical protein
MDPIVWAPFTIEMLVFAIQDIYAGFPKGDRSCSDDKGHEARSRERSLLQNFTHIPSPLSHMRLSDRKNRNHHGQFDLGE